MAWTEPSDAEVTSIVRSAKLVAVVGMKNESAPLAPAFTVPAHMKERGIRIIPVNPTIQQALGEPALASVAALRERPDVIQVFRRSELVEPVADEIAQLRETIRPRVVWLQSGIVNLAAAEKLEALGIRVVIDRCFAVNLAKLGR